MATHVSDVTAYLREAVDVFGSDNPLSVEALALRDGMLDLFRSDIPPDVGRAGALRATGGDLRRRFAEDAVAAHGRDRLDGAGDERKRHLLEGGVYRDLTRLTPIELLPGGRHASLEQELTDLRTCKTFDPVTLSRSVTCPECDYRPRPTHGATALARLEQIEQQVHSLHTEWEKALVDSLAASEMAEQIALLKAADKEMVETFVEARSLPRARHRGLRSGGPAGSQPLRGSPDRTAGGLEHLVPRGGARHPDRTPRALHQVDRQARRWLTRGACPLRSPGG